MVVLAYLITVCVCVCVCVHMHIHACVFECYRSL